MPCRKRLHFLLVGMLLCGVSCATVDQRAPPAPPLGGTTPSGSAPINVHPDVVTAAHSELSESAVLPAQGTHSSRPYGDLSSPSGTDAESLQAATDADSLAKLQTAPVEPSDRPLLINLASALRLADARPLVVA